MTREKRGAPPADGTNAWVEKGSGQRLLTLLKVAPSVSFPRRRESILLTMGPRLRGDDADFHRLEWVKGP